MSGEYEQAIVTYTRYMETYPADTGINIDIGRSYRKLKEFRKAEECLQKCFRTGSSDPGLHYELALVYVGMKDKSKALEHLNIALSIWKNADPGIPDVEDAKKKLAELKGS
jgi:tetratricopeptide (TPR) repeat protein